MTSKIYKIGGQLFRYNFDRSVVERVAKADPEMLEDNKEWQSKYHRDLWDIDENGYIIVSSVGLHRENWENKEARREYLEEWARELGEEDTRAAEMFIKYELPAIQRKAAKK